MPSDISGEIIKSYEHKQICLGTEQVLFKNLKECSLIMTSHSSYDFY